MTEPGPTLPGANPLDVACPDCAVPAGTPCAFSGGYEGVHADRQRTADLQALEQGTCALCGHFMVRGSVEGAPPDAWHPDPADADACPPIPNPEDNYEAWAMAVNLGLTPGHPGIEQFVPVDTIAVPDLTGQDVPDQDLPGAWTHADYEGGDPDERSYAQREADALTEQGRQLASEREDLIAAGVDPTTLEVPRAVVLAKYLCPECTAGKHGNCDGTAWDTIADQFTHCACAAADHPGATP